MKKVFLLAICFSLTAIGFSQKVKYKKGLVMVDDKEFLSLDKGGQFGAVTYELSELSSKKRIIMLVENNGGTHMHLADDYVQVKFLTVGQKADIRQKDSRDVIKFLIKNEILKADGTLDETKIELFIKNYDEKITERTVIRG